MTTFRGKDKTFRCMETDRDIKKKENIRYLKMPMYGRTPILKSKRQKLRGRNRRGKRSMFLFFKRRVLAKNIKCRLLSFRQLIK